MFSIGLRNLFDRALETSLGKLVFSYCFKNRRDEQPYIIYKTDKYEVTKENELTYLPTNIVGIIDQGMFLPYTDK